MDQSGRVELELDHLHTKPNTDSAFQAEGRKTEKADGHPVSGTSKNLPPTPHSDELTKASNEDGWQRKVPKLIFAEGIESKQKVAIEKKLSCLKVDVAQEVLDEWQAAMQSGKVRAPTALLTHFIELAKAGEFMPHQGIKVHTARLTKEKVRISHEMAEQKLVCEMEEKGIMGKGKPENLSADLEEYRRNKTLKTTLQTDGHFNN